MNAVTTSAMTVTNANLAVASGTTDTPDSAAVDSMMEMLKQSR